MLTVINPEQFHDLMMTLGYDLKLNKAMYYGDFWQYRHDINLALDKLYDVHVFEYFNDYLVLFGNSKREVIFKLRYSEYL